MSEVKEKARIKADYIKDAKAHFAKKNKPTKEEQNRLDELLNGLRVKASEYEFPPVSVITFKGQNIGSQGDVTTVTGQAKSKKTYLLSAILIESLKPFTYPGVIQVTMPKDKQKILWIDTEQSRYWGRKILERAESFGVSAEDIDSKVTLLTCRTLSASDIMELVELYLKKHSDIGLLVLDGVREIVNSINDDKEATSAVKWMMRMATDHNLHLITVLHLNPQKDENSYAKVRGHIGTELTNKSEFVIKVTPEKESKAHSTVEAMFSRGAAPEKMSMYIDEEGRPMFTEYIEPAASSKTPVYEEYTEWDIMFEKAFESDAVKRHTFNNLVDILYDFFLKEFGNPIPNGYGINAIRNKWIPYMEEKGKIIRSKEGGENYDKYNFNEAPF